MSVRSGSPAISTVSSTSVMPAEHVQTIGVRRPGIGTAGRALKVITNHWEVTSAPDTLVYQYDGMFLLPDVCVPTCSAYVGRLVAIS